MNTKEDWEKMLQDAGNGYNQRISALEGISRSLLMRIIALEGRAHSAYDPAVLKAQATQIEATHDLYSPVRNDTEAIVKLANLARRLLDPQDLGHAVTFEVRELAREALGKEKVG